MKELVEFGRNISLEGVSIPINQTLFRSFFCLTRM